MVFFNCSTKIMWFGLALFAIGLYLTQSLGTSWYASTMVSVGLLLYLGGAFNLGQRTKRVSRSERTHTDMIMDQIDENDRLMLTGIGIFLLGAGAVATGWIPTSYGFISALTGLIMFVGGALSLDRRIEELKRRSREAR